LPPTIFGIAMIFSPLFGLPVFFLGFPVIEAFAKYTAQLTAINLTSVATSANMENATAKPALNFYEKHDDLRSCKQPEAGIY